MIILHEDPISGNSYKPRLLLTQLGIPFKAVCHDILKGETRTPAFLKLNPNGRIPVLELGDGRTLAESNAILFYLAEGSPYLEDDRYGRAQTLQWMFFEQYSHEPYVAVARFLKHIPDPEGKNAARFPDLYEKGYAALKVMENHLAKNRYFVADRYSIADIALYAYTHVADEGGFDLSPYPALNDWLERIRSAPRHVAMQGFNKK
jgi:glutathione S-transferase